MWGYPSQKVLCYMRTQNRIHKPQTRKYKKFEELIALIDQKDRCHRGAWDAWDLINSLVNQVYGIDIGDALVLWARQNS